MISIDILIALVLTLFVFSFVLWRTKDNLMYRFAEHTFVAVSLGNMTVLAIKYLQGNVINPIIYKGDYILIIVLILGCLLYLRFSKRFFYICRWPLSFMVGVGLGLTLRGWTHGWLFSGIITPTILSLAVVGDAFTTFNNIFVIVCTLTVLSYFIFSIQHKGALRYSATLGRYFMMVMFGVMFSNYTFSRLATLSGRLLWVVQSISSIFA